MLKSNIYLMGVVLSLVVLATPATTMPSPTIDVIKPAEPVCYDKDAFYKFVDENKLGTLLQGEVKNGKVVEIMINTDRKAYVVSFDKPGTEGLLNVKKFCMVEILDNVVFNPNAIESLNKALDKIAPKT